MSSIIGIFIVALTFAVAQAKDKDVYATTIKKVECTLNPEYFQNGTCKLKPIRRYVSVLDINAILVKQMTTAWVNADRKILFQGSKFCLVDSFESFP
jgi:hypothetical protein